MRPRSGGDDIVPRLHPAGGLGGGHAPLLHQLVNLRAALLRPDEHPPRKEEGKQDVHPQVNPQQSEKEPGIQPQDDGRLDPARRTLIGFLVQTDTPCKMKGEKGIGKAGPAASYESGKRLSRAALVITRLRTASINAVRRPSLSLFILL